MSNAATVPDAWEDDWEVQADQAAARQHVPAADADADADRCNTALTKAERLRRHAEENRKIWESADSPKTFHYLETSNEVPLTWSFSPQVMVLSRKPVLAKRDSATGKAQRALDEDEGDDDDAKAAEQPSPEEIRARQKREREEKQRRYDEARAKIFGESVPSSRGSSPGIVTPPRVDSRTSSSLQARGRGRGGGQKIFVDSRHQSDMRRQGKHSTSNNNTNNKHNGQTGRQPRELYDPNAAPKPEPISFKGRGAKKAPTTDEPMQPIRAPRGPDASGQRGFGFAKRGA